MLARHKCVAARGNMGVLAADGENQTLVWPHRRDECLPFEDHGQLLPLLPTEGADRSRNLLRFR